MSIRHMEDLRKIRPVMAFIVEHHAEVFQDLKPLPQPSKLGMGGSTSHNMNLVNHGSSGQGLGAQGQGLVTMGGVEGGLTALGSTLPSSLISGSNNTLEDATGLYILQHTLLAHAAILQYILLAHCSSIHH